jgi:FlaA1/EpsC-like NDP-sugar epimerase
MINIKSRPKTSTQVLDSLSVFYSEKKVLVTGGASFIGSHLVDALLALGSKVTVIDDFSSGKNENLPHSNVNLDVITLDIFTSNDISKHFQSIDYVFHLAAIHGGRGFIEKYPQLGTGIVPKSERQRQLEAEPKRYSGR